VTVIIDYACIWQNNMTNLLSTVNASAGTIIGILELLPANIIHR